MSIPPQAILFHVTIHLTVLISARRILLACCFLVAQHFVPYNIVGLVLGTVEFLLQFYEYLVVAQYSQSTPPH